MSIVSRTPPLRRHRQAERPAGQSPPRRTPIRLPREVPVDAPTALTAVVPVKVPPLTRTPLPIGDTSLTTAVRSALWLLDRCGYPAPHRELVADYLGHGGDVETCPGLADTDRGPVADLIARRRGLVEPS